MADIRKRENVFNLGSDWAEPILWYARGVKGMKSRKLADRTSWNFYAAIHGLGNSRPIWDFYGATDAADPDPSPGDMADYADQCQHQSWFFLPWHRGYLYAFEAMIRHEIELLGGPHETWALPYWNYFEPGQNVLPPAFASQTWPDDSERNPLFAERYGRIVTAAPFDIRPWTNLNALGDPDFFGPGGGASAGFGGPLTAFNWGSGTNGSLEFAPHNSIHGLVGGQHPTMQVGTPPRPLPGPMGSPQTAALDPIFYLHHCNIDRLWEAWEKYPTDKASTKPTDWKPPTHQLWRDGPRNVGQRAFAMPTPTGGRWDFTPADLESISLLGYSYDTLRPGPDSPTDLLTDRMVALGVPIEAMTDKAASSMKPQNGSEMIGANKLDLALSGSASKRTLLTTVPDLRSKVARSIQQAGLSKALPDRVFLNLENVTGLSDAVMFQVYVGLPDEHPSEASPGHLAGSVALFGVSQASDIDAAHGGNGLTFTMEITSIIDRLVLSGRFELDDLAVDLVPLGTIPAEARVNIGRISIFRQFE